jgi:very-short-patch-repair endonuclease
LVSPLDRGTIGEARSKVPLVRGQSLQNSGGSLGVAAPEIQSPFKRINYNPKLSDRSKKMSRYMTKAEQKIWFEVLSEKKLNGYKFIKQKIIDNYILDFYCAELLLAIEIDGESHNEKLGYDKVRDDFLKGCGITVLRFTNEEVLENLEGVRERVVRWVKVRCE